MGDIAIRKQVWKVLKKKKRIRIFFSDFCEIVIYTIDNFTFYRLKTKKN